MPLSQAQRKVLEIAQRRGWVRSGGANDNRTIAALVKLGLLELHPDYEAGVYRPTTSEDE